MTRRVCYALDLIEDAALIAEYERRHAAGALNPAITHHIRAQGFEAMEIWRTGTRLLMIAEVTDDFPRTVAEPPENQEWERLMWQFQQPLPHAKPGEKWMEMTRIFNLGDQ